MEGTAQGGQYEGGETGAQREGDNVTGAQRGGCKGTREGEVGHWRRRLLLQVVVRGIAMVDVSGIATA